MCLNLSPVSQHALTADGHDRLYQLQGMLFAGASLRTSRSESSGGSADSRSDSPMSDETALPGFSNQQSRTSSDARGSSGWHQALAPMPSWLQTCNAQA